MNGQNPMQMRQGAIPQGSMQQASMIAGLTPQQVQMLQAQAAQAHAAQAQAAQYPDQVMNGNHIQLVTAGGRVMSTNPILLYFTYT